MSDFWFGPTYEFRSGNWSLKAGVRAEEGRLEWLLTETDQEGADVVSHSFVLEPHGTSRDLSELLDDVPPEIAQDLVAQVLDQRDPPLLSSEGGEEGIA